MNTHIGKGRFRLGWILIAIATVFALFGFVSRWRYENALRGVQLTVDYEDTRSLADAYQIPHGALLRQLKARGVTSVGVYEQSLTGLRDNARISINTREVAERIYPNAKWAQLLPAYRYVISASPQNQPLLQELLRRIREQAQPSLPPRVLALAPNSLGIAIPASRQLTTDALMGFDPAQLRAVRAAGLGVTARVSNSLNLNKARVTQLLSDAAATGARVVIFSEDEVLGYDTLYKEVGEEMKRRGLLFGNIEFSKQRGWPDFAKQTEGLVVRVHSVGIDEAAKAKAELLVDRYARAIKERNVRVVYIRLVRQFKGETVEGVQKSALQQNLDFVAGITREVRLQRTPSWLRPALVTSTAQAFGAYPYAASTREAQDASVRRAQMMQAALRFVCALGAVGAVLLLLNLFFDLSPASHARWFFAGVFLVALLTLATTFLDKGQSAGAKIIGLVIGVTFSVIGILWGGLPKLWDSYEEKQFAPVRAMPKIGAVFVQAFLILLKTTAITLLGAILIVAIMNDWKFLSHTDEFLGEKATLLAPLLLVGLAFSGSVFPHRVAQEGAAAAAQRARGRFFGLLGEAFTVKIALVLAALAVAGMLFIARTGNDSGMEISDFEWYTRAYLERWFWTRPRTKEMFVGVPAMIFVVWFAHRRQWVPALLAVAAVTIGQADIINTFCHFWTPLFYSLLRTVHAVWIGSILGLLALMLYIFAERRFLGRLRPISLPQRPANIDAPDEAEIAAPESAPAVAPIDEARLRPSRTVGIATLPPRDQSIEPLAPSGIIRPENRDTNPAVTGGLFTPTRPRPEETPPEPRDDERAEPRGS